MFTLFAKNTRASASSKHISDYIFKSRRFQTIFYFITKISQEFLTILSSSDIYRISIKVFITITKSARIIILFFTEGEISIHFL